MEPNIITSFHVGTATWQYIVFDPKTREGVIIDSVLDFDPSCGKISTETADALLDTVRKSELTIVRILETHAHADHLTAARYLQQKLVQVQHQKPQICIGKRITIVQQTFAERYAIDAADLTNVFDHLFDDDEPFALGELVCKVLYLPGHTPDHVGYMIGSNIFTGDSIFNPDVGSARADFPGGSASTLYKSTRTLLSLPAHYKLYTGHDYPPADRPISDDGNKFKAYTTVAEQNASNRHVKAGTLEDDFVTWRAGRDATLGEPRLLHQALQINIRAGRLPRESSGRVGMPKIPLKSEGDLLEIMKE